MTTDNFGFYLQNGLIQTSQTGGQWYSDTSPFSIPCISGTLDANVDTNICVKLFSGIFKKLNSAALLKHHLILDLSSLLLNQAKFN
jgi:hypothetical protein